MDEKLIDNKKGGKNNIKILIGIFIGIIALFLSFKDIEFERLFLSVKNCNLYHMLAAIIFFFFSRSIRSVLWNISVGIDIKTALYTFWASDLIGIILPFRGGELSRIAFIAKVSNWESGITASFLERGLDLFFLALLAVICSRHSSYINNISPVNQGIILGLIAFILLISLKSGHGILLKLFNKFSNKLPSSLKKLINFIMKITYYFHKISWKNFLIIMLLSGTGWLFALLSTYFRLLAFHYPHNINDIILYIVILNLGLSIPSLPAGIGIFEYITIVVFKTWGIEREDGLGFAFVSHFINIIIIVIVGLISWPLWVKSKKVTSPDQPEKQKNENQDH